MSFLKRYRSAVARGALKSDAEQEAAAKRLELLANALRFYRPGRGFFGPRKAPRGLYIWGDVGRGKSMLMDLFFAEVALKTKRRVHFNAFMVDIHARIHAARSRSDVSDPIPVVSRAIANEATLLCFDEFQVTDVADALILGRLFEQLFERGTVIIATSNTPPDKLYEGGLNRQLFLPFIALIHARLDVVSLNGPIDYRLERMTGLNLYLTPLTPQTDAAMDAVWRRLTGDRVGVATTLTVLGRTLRVPAAASGVARFTFDDLCVQPLAAPDFLAIARSFHTVMMDRIPVMGPNRRNEARRFVLLIDTLYDEGVKLVCSAAAPPDKLYIAGDGADAFRRTVSRLIEMQGEAYLKRGHGVHGLVLAD